MVKWRIIYKKYKVSSKGKLKRQKKGKWIMMKPFNAHGYPTTKIFINGKRTTKGVHQLVAFAFIPNPNFLPCVNHKDENKMNNNVENLEWCTHKYNLEYNDGIARRKRTRLINKERSKPTPPLYIIWGLIV